MAGPLVIAKHRILAAWPPEESAPPGARRPALLEPLGGQNVKVPGPRGFLEPSTLASSGLETGSFVEIAQATVSSL